MTDGIIKGTGNSRYLKVPPDALTRYPTWEAAAQAMIQGTFPIDLNGVNPAGWDVQGDKLNKATLLTDTLCSALGLATTATPTQAMDKLREMIGNISSYGSFVSADNFKVTLTFPFPPKLCILWQDLHPANNPSTTLANTSVYIAPTNGTVFRWYYSTTESKYILETGGVQGNGNSVNIYVRFPVPTEYYTFVYNYIAFG